MENRFKFRGIVKLDTQNIVIYSSFLKNYDDELVLSVSESDGVKQIKDAGYKLTDKDWDKIYRYSDQDDYYPWFHYSWERVDQCTGLKDKNGKLIYESDIVKDLEGYKGEVSYDETSGRFIIEFASDISDFLNDDPSELEVIGNIHKNADLLGEE